MSKPKIWITIIAGGLAWFLFWAGFFWWGIGVAVLGVLMLIGQHEEDKEAAYERSYLKETAPVKLPVTVDLPVSRPETPITHSGYDETEIDRLLRSLEDKPKPSARKAKKPSKNKKKSSHSGEIIQIDYLDVNDEWTNREVRVSGTTSKHIEGFCYLRNQTRTFRRDRIQGDILVMDTGELVDPFDY